MSRPARSPSGKRVGFRTTPQGGARLSRLSRRIGRQPQQGRLAGYLTKAGRQSSERRSWKGPATLALAAGAAGIAVLKRARSNAANEPIGQVFEQAEHQGETQAPETGPPAEEPPKAQGPLADMVDKPR